MKIIGLDLGTTTLGFAITDESRIIVRGYENFRFEKGNFKKAREHLVDILNKEGVNEVVIGLPINLDGTEGDRASSTRRFMNDVLKLKPDLIVHYEDERMTTVVASKRLHEMNLNTKKQKEIIDEMSAVVILEDYLRKN